MQLRSTRRHVRAAPVNDGRGAAEPDCNQRSLIAPIGVFSRFETGTLPECKAFTVVQVLDRSLNEIVVLTDKIRSFNHFGERPSSTEDVDIIR